MKTLFLDFDGALHCMAQTGAKPFERLPLLEPLVVGTTGEASIGRYARHREIVEYTRCYRLTDWRALDNSFLEFPENAHGLIWCNPRTGVSAREVDALREWLLD